MSAGWQLTASTLNQQVSQYATSSSCRTQYYTELIISSQHWPKPSPVLIAPIHGGMATLSGPEWPGKYRDSIPKRWSPMPVLTDRDVA